MRERDEEYFNIAGQPVEFVPGLISKRPERRVCMASQCAEMFHLNLDQCPLAVASVGDHRAEAWDEKNIAGGKLSNPRVSHDLSCLTMNIGNLTNLSKMVQTRMCTLSAAFGSLTIRGLGLVSGSKLGGASPASGVGICILKGHLRLATDVAFGGPYLCLAPQIARLPVIIGRLSW